MKNAVRLAIILLLSAAFFYNAAAQEKSSTVKTLSSADFEVLLSKKPGQTFTLHLTEGLSFEGEVISNEIKFGTLHIGVARSVKNPNILLQFHQLIREDKSVVYAGKLITEGQVYFLQFQKDGQMTTQTKPIHEIIQDCSMH